MKKLLTFVVAFCFFGLVSIDAAYMENYKSTYVDPDGRKLTIYTTGDEYFKYSHDKKGNVIVLNDKGYYVYASLKNEKVVPSNNIYDGDKVPSKTIKGNDIDTSKNTELVNQFEEDEVVIDFITGTIILMETRDK